MKKLLSVLRFKNSSVYNLVLLLVWLLSNFPVSNLLYLNIQVFLNINR